jgi:hypothetical protein
MVLLDICILRLPCVKISQGAYNFLHVSKLSAKHEFTKNEKQHAAEAQTFQQSSSEILYMPVSLQILVELP